MRKTIVIHNIKRNALGRIRLDVELAGNRYDTDVTSHMLSSHTQTGKTRIFTDVECYFTREGSLIIEDFYGCRLEDTLEAMPTLEDLIQRAGSYKDLILLIYDIGTLCNCSVNRLVDILDQIEALEDENRGGY